MINFNLRCENSHEFHSWFRNNDAFETLQANNLVECPICQSTTIERGLNSPNIASNLLDNESKNAREYAKKMRDKIMNEFLNAGDNFAEKAREFHQNIQEKQEVPYQGIYGSVNAEEAQELHEEGIKIIPLPSNFFEKDN